MAQIDPSIPLQVQQFQMPDPMATMAKVGALKNQQQAHELNELQLQDARQRQAGQARAAQEEAALSELLSQDRIPSPGEINRIVGPERGMAIYRGLIGLQQDKQKAYGSTQELLRDVLLGMNALPEGLRATAYGPVRQNLLTRQLIAPEDAPDSYDPAWWQQTMAFGQQPETPKPPEPFTLSPGQQRFNPDGSPIASVATAPPAGFNLSPGQTRFGPDGKPVASLPPTPQAPSTKEPTRMWVMRNGQPVRVTEADIQPGDRPISSREQGRPVTSGDAGRVADFDTSLDDLQVLSGAVSEKGSTGVSAQIGAALPAWVTATTGWGTSAKQKQAMIDRVKQVIGKTLEGGVLRKEDEVKYEKILPTIKDSNDIVLSKLKDLGAAIEQRKSRFIDALEDSDYDVTKHRARGNTEPTAAAPVEGATKEIPGYPGTEQTFKGGKWIRTK